MLTATARHDLTVSVDPIGRTARVELPSIHRSAPAVIVVRRDGSDDCWIVDGPTDGYRSRRSTFGAAVAGAIEQATGILRDYLSRGMLGPARCAGERAGLGPTDIC
jgi:hypothetical protein